ncbi:MAG: response regulator [Rhodospirillaceae bacterium]
MAVGAPLQQEIDFSKTVFLVVDDKPFYRDMAHTAVMRARAKDVKHAASVETAIQLLNRLGQAIDCVIVDWDIAPEGGLELLRKIRTKSLPKTPARTPVVILTGKPDSAAVMAAKKLDVNGFAVAPLSIEKLVKTIANAIGRTWTLQEPGVYAAVPAVTPTLAEPERPKGIGGPARVVIKHEQVAEGATAQARASHGAVASSAAAKHFNEAELINVHMIPLNEVKAGVILARDLHDKSGHLLLKSGTELKAGLISRLNDVAGGHGEAYHVWVGEWERAQ